MTLTVMLVDDDAGYRHFARSALENEGVEVLAEAGGGCEALRLLRDSHPDVVLLDIGLPDLPGPEVARRLRTIGDGPVVILISSREPEYGRRVAASLAAGYIAKDQLSLASILGLVDASQ